MSELWRLRTPPSRGQQIRCLISALFLIQRWLFLTVFSHGSWAKAAPLFIRVLIPFMKANLS
jgi:hypothetical protein